MNHHNSIKSFYLLDSSGDSNFSSEESNILSFVQKYWNDNILSLNASNSYSKNRINLKKFVGG